MNQTMIDIPWGAIAPVLVVQFLLLVTALVSCIREERVKGPKWAWILVIIFIGFIGPVLYFTVGRRND